MVLMNLLPDQESVCGGWFGLPPRPRTRDFDGLGGSGALIGLFCGKSHFLSYHCRRPASCSGRFSDSVGPMKKFRGYHLLSIGALLAENGAHGTSCPSS